MLNKLMSRLNKIMDGLAGYQLEFQRTEQVHFGEWSLSRDELLFGHGGGFPSFVEGINKGRFGFPVYIGDEFKGLVAVRGWEQASDKNLILLAELLALIFQESIQGAEKNELLRALEERIQLDQTKSDSGSNVVPFRKTTHRLHMEMLESMVMEDELVPPPPVADLSTEEFTIKPLLVQTGEGFPIQKLAVEIHQYSKRWAMLSMNDLPKTVFDNRKNLEELGGITLLIPDVAQLSVEQQIKIAEYLGLPATPERPHIIAASSLPVGELLKSGRLLAHFVKCFCFCDLPWTEKDAQSREVINNSMKHILEQAREVVQPAKNLVPFHLQYFDPTPNRFH